MVNKDTIVAPATPPGEGGIGIVRLSGNQSEDFLRRLFHPHYPHRTFPRFQSHHLYYGDIFSVHQRPIDEVMAVVMRAPHSYTCEDVAEVHCHGGPVVMRQIVENFLRLGARLADPGEFTLRAFLNGRLDLTQAEAVIDLIRARSDRASEIAVRQLSGKLGNALDAIKEGLLNVLAIIEAHIDFPEEELPPVHRENLESSAQKSLDAIGKILNSFAYGRIAKEGIAVVLTGRPNVGKSSILNALLEEERAIVTDIPGTTRDAIEGRLTVGGFLLNIVDTAGIHSTENVIESAGIRKTLKHIEYSDIVLFIVERDTFTEEDKKIFDICKSHNMLILFNKRDLGDFEIPEVLRDFPSVKISAHTGYGMGDLKKMIMENISQRFNALASEEDAIISSQRCWESLHKSQECINRFLNGLDGTIPWECLALEIKDALVFLGEVTGETFADDVLKKIFSEFCIGK